MAPATTTSNNSSAAAATNWLSFSLSPMEMLRSSSSSSQSQFMSYEGSSSAAAPSSAVLPAPLAATASHHHYFIDNFYAPPHGWANPKVTQAAEALAETSILTSLIVDPETQHQVPKLEDFLGDSSSIVRYSDNSQTETQDDSSLTHIYDPNSAANYFSEQQDLKAIAGFPAFSANSGSEVDDSASIARTHHHRHHHHHHHQHHQLGGGGGCGTEFPGRSIESAGNELCLPNANNAALSLGVNSNATATTTSNTINQASTEKGLVPVASAEPDCDKKIADTFGQRTSIYRGVTRHRWTGRYEAHLWDNSCRREGQARKGRQVYLGGYDKEVKAARAYDLAALKYWGPTATTNFPVSNYTKELEDMKYVSKQEFIASLRRKSSGFSRGASIYRGVTRHHQQGRWQARIGRVAGNKDLYLGTFATEEEAAEAYDIAAIKFRGMNAVTNFEMNRYDVEAIMKSTLPIGGAAKRLKLSVDAEQKPLLDQQPHCSSNSISFGSVHPVSTIPCGVPFDPATTYYHHHNLFHHLQAGGSYITTTDSSGSNSSLASQMTMVPQTTEFYIWPHQSY